MCEVSMDRHAVRARIAELDKFLADNRRGETSSRFVPRPGNLIQQTICREQRAILKWADSAQTLTAGGRQASVPALRFILERIEESERIIKDARECLDANGG